MTTPQTCCDLCDHMSMDNDHNCRDMNCPCHTKHSETDVETHTTQEGYCCACGYDIAGFEEKLAQARTEGFELGIDKKFQDDRVQKGYEAGAQAYKEKAIKALERETTYKGNVIGGFTEKDVFRHILENL